MIRDEIARLFTEQAQKTYEEWLDLLGHDRAMAKSNVWKDHAAQVEKMRCETCEYRPSLTCENERSVGFMNLVEYNNGCFHYKPKVTG